MKCLLLRNNYRQNRVHTHTHTHFNKCNLYTCTKYNIPYSAVPAPTIDTVEPTSFTSLTVDWTIPSSEHIITGYRLSYTPVDSQCSEIKPGMAIVEGRDTTQYILTGLEEGVTYNITIQARGEQAFGVHSESTTTFTMNKGLFFSCCYDGTVYRLLDVQCTYIPSTSDGLAMLC